MPSITHNRPSESIAEDSRRKSRQLSPVPPVPRPFDFGFTARRPLVPMTAVSMFLDRDARQVSHLIEEGKLRWAFDIRSGKAKQREIRILRQSLFEFTGLYAPEKIELDEAAEFLAVCDLILPPGIILTPRNVAGLDAAGGAAKPLSLKFRLPAVTLLNSIFPREPVLGATEIGRCFSCQSQHVGNLARENLLSAVNLRRGPKASPLITRASVAAFLRQRRIA